MTETGSPSNAQFAMSIKWEPISAISPPEYSRYIRQLIRRSYFASATGLPLVTAGAAGMAALLSTLSSAAGHGSAGAIIIAGSGFAPRTARGRPGDDVTGDKAVRELIAKTKSHYY